MGGKFHLKLNMGERPIANKYREGKMKSTLKREWKVREIVERETLEASQGFLEIRRLDLSSWALGLAFWADSVFDFGESGFCTSLVNKSTSVWQFGKKVTGFGWALIGLGLLGLKACLSWYQMLDWGSQYRSLSRTRQPCGSQEIRQPSWFFFWLFKSCPILAGSDFGCWRNGFKRPVLKHGPRSLTWMQVFGW
jgi:hypothetical protein